MVVSLFRFGLEVMFFGDYIFSVRGMWGLKRNKVGDVAVRRRRNVF